MLEIYENTIKMRGVQRYQIITFSNLTKQDKLPAGPLIKDEIFIISELIKQQLATALAFITEMIQRLILWGN